MKTSFHFNGDAQLVLTPENDYDWKLLDLCFGGTVVKEIRKPVRDSETKESLTIVLTRDNASKPPPVLRVEPATAPEEN